MDKRSLSTIKHFTGTVLGAYEFPLPSLAEQCRIVAKADQLMAHCDRLEAGLDAADGTRSRLLESLLQDSLTPSAYNAREVRA